MPNQTSERFFLFFIFKSVSNQCQYPLNSTKYLKQNVAIFYWIYKSYINVAFLIYKSVFKVYLREKKNWISSPPSPIIKHVNLNKPFILSAPIYRFVKWVSERFSLLTFPAGEKTKILLSWLPNISFACKLWNPYPLPKIINFHSGPGDWTHVRYAIAKYQLKKFKLNPFSSYTDIERYSCGIIIILRYHSDLFARDSCPLWSSM